MICTLKVMPDSGAGVEVTLALEGLEATASVEGSVRVDLVTVGTGVVVACCVVVAAVEVLVSGFFTGVLSATVPPTEKLVVPITALSLIHISEPTRPY